MGFEVEGPHHANVWPGVQLVNCPALGSAQLAPDSTQRVPVGNYTLVVNDNRHFSFPLHVVAH